MSGRGKKTQENATKFYEVQERPDVRARVCSLGLFVFFCCVSFQNCARQHANVWMGKRKGKEESEMH